MHGICVACKKELYDEHKPKDLCHKCNAQYNRVILKIKKITFSLDSPSFWARFKMYNEKSQRHETSTSGSKRPRRKVHLDEKTCESAVAPSISANKNPFMLNLELNPAWDHNKTFSA